MTDSRLYPSVQCSVKNLKLTEKLQERMWQKKSGEIVADIFSNGMI